VRISPLTPVALVPTTIWDKIASPPSVISVQLGPSGPFALLKLSVADTAKAVRGNSAIEKNPMTTRDKSENALVLTVLLGIFLPVFMTPHSFGHFLQQIQFREERFSIQ
jgi:hypothetical protein